MKFNSKKNDFTKKQVITLSIAGVIFLSLIVILLITLFRHTHSFGEWEKVRDASCTRYGMERRYCECGEVQEKKSDMLPHTEGEWTYNKEKDELTKSCTVCEKVLKTDPLDNHTHTWGEFSVKAEATCTQSGVNIRSCNCGATYELPIAATGHDFGDWITSTPAQCGTEGSSKRICNNCQESETKIIPALSHTKGAWILVDNKKLYPCIYCDEILYSEQIKASEYLDISNGVLIGLGTCEDLEVIVPSDVHTVGEYAFEVQSITGIVLPNSVIHIENRAFFQCFHLDTVYFGENLKSIAKTAFFNCESLKSVTLPESLTTIGEYAFAYCTGLESISIGSNVTEFNMRLLGDCLNLRDIYYSGTIEQWNAIEKHVEWDLGTGEYIVHCSDGDIEK